MVITSLGIYIRNLISDFLYCSFERYAVLTVLTVNLKTIFFNKFWASFQNSVPYLWFWGRRNHLFSCVVPLPLALSVKSYAQVINVMEECPDFDLFEDFGYIIKCHSSSEKSLMLHMGILFSGLGMLVPN